MNRILIIMMLLTVYATSRELNIYIDADYSNYSESSESIEMGVKTALSLSQNSFAGYNINIIRKDHKANSRRSLKHLKDIKTDPNRLVAFSGLHSPPVLANKKFINENKILFFSPWAAAAPITRASSPDNWIFRLSVDDSKAGFFLVDQMLKNNLIKPFVLLEKTGWGESNFKTITQSLKSNQIKAVGIEFFNWEPTEATINSKIRKIINTGADSILFVGNSTEGQLFANAMNKFGIKTPVLSHWGINGGGFFEKVGFAKLNQQKWSFIQTSFSFMQKPLPAFPKKVLDKAKMLFPQKIDDNYIKSPSGFIHAFDMTLILAQAWEKVDKNGKWQAELKQTLENGNFNVQGLIKNYQKPFSPYKLNSPDAHEALGIKELKMAEFNELGQVILK
ncbi:MAG: ABC transporter substrate-binding protein [Lentisphaerales bacterium]|nr:ABC transporter substrate-binding protein [Lentisphaerales bacterium]